MATAVFGREAELAAVDAVLAAARHALDCDGLADDLMVDIPAVGAAGGNPLPGFLEGIFGANQ